MKASFYLLPSIFYLLALTLFAPGCASTPAPGSPPALTSALVQVACFDAACLGTQQRLASHPEDRPRFVAALAALDTLSKTGSGSVTELRAALADIRQLQSPAATVLADLATVTISTAADSVDLAKAPALVKLAIESIAAGLRKGLGP